MQSHLQEEQDVIELMATRWQSHCSVDICLLLLTFQANKNFTVQEHVKLMSFAFLLSVLLFLNILHYIILTKYERTEQESSSLIHLPVRSQKCIHS